MSLKFGNLAQIRRAVPQDSREIHDAHMKSICEVCKNDYSPEELRAWGGREYREDIRIRDIGSDHVWVAEVDHKTHGFAHLKMHNNHGEVIALYLAPEIVGQGIGKRLIQIIEDECRSHGIYDIELNSTRTAIQFYKKLGFIEKGPEGTMTINGVPIPCTPMKKHLN